ncbi:MAG: stage III sporulation protein AF [Clostridia bacterium]|nr:stage III sporulation protein AF [Clostridia bacterium]
MSSFKQIITVLSCVFIFFGAIQMLAPKSKMEKPLKYILALTLLVVIISTVFGIKNMDIDIKTPTLNSDYLNAGRTYQTSAEYLIGAALKDNSVEFSKVSAKVDILEDESIVISEVIVYTSHNADTVSGIIKRHFNVLEVCVVNE